MLVVRWLLSLRVVVDVIAFVVEVVVVVVEVACLL